MKSRRYAAVLLLIGASVAALLTPLGPWSVLRLSAPLIAPWTLHVREVDGSLWSGVTLRDASLSNEALRVRLRAKEITLSPSRRALALRQPHLSLGRSEEVASSKNATTQIFLPTAWLPNMQAIDGRIDIELDDSNTLRIRGWQGRYRRGAEQTGSLKSTIDTWQVDGDTLLLSGSCATHITLHPTQLIVDSLHVPIHTDAMRAQIRASGTLSLAGQRLVEAQYSISAPTSDNPFGVEGPIAGSLRPLNLQSTLGIHMTHRRLGPLNALASVRLDTTHINVDSLHADGAGGTLSGRIAYILSSDSLQVDLQVERIALAQIDTTLAGHADGLLQAEFDLAHRRYRAESTLRLQDLAWTEMRPFHATLRAQHEDDGTTLLSLDSAPVQLALRGQSDLSGHYDLRAEGQLAPTALFDIDMPPITLHGMLRPDTLHWTAHTAQLPILSNASFGPLRAEANISSSGHGQIHVAVEEDLLIGYGQFDLNSEHADSLSLAVRALPLHRLHPQAEGILSFDLSATGPWKRDGIDAYAEAQVRNFSYATWRGGDLTGHARWTNNRGNSQLRTPHARADISIDSAQYFTANVALSGPQLQASTEDALVLSGHLSLRGPVYDLDRSQGQLTVDMLKLSYASAHAASKEPFQIDLAEGSAILPPIHLRTSMGPLNLTGMAAADTLSVHADWPHINPQVLMPTLSAEQGIGHITLSGRPAQPRATGWLDLQAVSIDTLLLGDIRAQWSLRDTLRAHTVLRQNGRRAVQLNVSWPFAQSDQPDARVRVALRVDTLSLRAPLTHALDRPARGQLSLRWDLNTPLNGTAPMWAPGALRGDVRIDQLSVETQNQNHPIHVTLTPGAQLHANDATLALRSLDLNIRRYDRDAEKFLPAGELSLEGRLPALTAGSAQLRITDLDLLLLGITEGRLNVNGQFTGTHNDPHLSVRMDAQTSDLGHIEGTLSGDRTESHWNLRWATPLTDWLSVKGYLPWDLNSARIDWRNGKVNAHTDRIDLAALSPLLTDLDQLSGHMAGHVQAHGLDSTMTLNGQIEFEDVEWALLDVKPTYPLPDGRIDFSGRRGRLSGFSAGKTPAYDAFTLSGQLDLSSFAKPHFDLALDTRGLDLHYEDLFRADDVDLQLRINGSALHSRLSGRVALHAPVAEPVLVVLNAPPVPPPPPALRDELFENMELDVQMELRDLRVDSELTNANTSGGIGISGTFYKPVFQGDLNLNEGTLYLLNRSFELREGRIALNDLVPTRSLLEVAYDPLELNPDLDLSATAQVVDRGDADRQYTVTMSLQGPAQSAAPRFESTPALSFNRIVNLLAFGTTDVSNFNYGTALGTAAGRLLSKRVEKVGIDEFAILPSSAIMGIEQGEPALRMGKFFDMPFPMWFRYEAAISNMSQGEVRIEHRLNSIFTLTGSAQSEYDRYGLGVGLQKEF